MSTTRSSPVHPIAPTSTRARVPELHKDGLHTCGDVQHKTSRFGRFRDILLRTLNITCSLREYWLLLASWVLSVPGEVAHSKSTRYGCFRSINNGTFALGKMPS
jgi:hypothetical protein